MARRRSTSTRKPTKDEAAPAQASASTPAKHRAPQEPNSATNQYGLTARQWRFLELYPSCDFNGTKAAIAAGYKGRNATKWASMTLKKQRVREALQEMMSKESQFYELTRGRIIKAWMDRAFGSIQDLGDNPGNEFRFKQLSTLTTEQAAQIESITQSVNNKGKVVMGVTRSTTKALEMLTKIMQLAEPQAEPESRGAFVRWLEEQKRADSGENGDGDGDGDADADADGDE